MNSADNLPPTLAMPQATLWRTEATAPAIEAVASVIETVASVIETVASVIEPLVLLTLILVWKLSAQVFAGRAPS